MYLVIIENCNTNLIAFVYFRYPTEEIGSVKWSL